MLALLHIPQGITAIVGSGGKTALTLALAQLLPGRCAVCTTTKIYPPAGIPQFDGSSLSEISRAFQKNRVLCVAACVSGGKLTAPLCSLTALRSLCDYLLVEADGSRGLPLKAHLPHEPVIPLCTDRVLLVAGLSGLGRPIQAVVHRPEQFSALCHQPVTAPVTPEALAAVLRAEALSDTVILNQLDAGEYDASAQMVASLLSCRVLAGSIQQGELRELSC